MRGKDNSVAWLWDGHRITPAYAGKSCKLDVFKAYQWDHPRVCGEKCVV